VSPAAREQLLEVESLADPANEPAAVLPDQRLDEEDEPSERDVGKRPNSDGHRKGQMVADKQCDQW